MKRIIIWIKTIYYFLTSINCCKKSKILNIEDTKKLVLLKKKSIIRLGDGEFNLINGKDIHYQKYSDNLKSDLETIITKYLEDPEKVNYILCMPGEYFRPNGLKLAKRKVYVSSWSFSRYLFKKKYDREIIYGDSFLFGKGKEEIFKQIWTKSGVQNVIFVHNQEEFALEFEKRFSIKTESIKIPSKNAYQKKEHILKKIMEAATDKTDLMVLISAGPCAKYLVQQLAGKNIWAIDTGHCWDDPLNLMEK